MEMIRMEVPQAIKISWNQLRKRGIPGKTTMSQTHRWGMISPMSPAFRKIGIQYKCLACGKDFPSLIPDTRDHQCPYENIFREYTGRSIGLRGAGSRRSPLKKGLKSEELNTSNISEQPVIHEVSLDPERFILWNASLITERNQLREQVKSLMESLNKMKKELTDSKAAFDRINAVLQKGYITKLNNEQGALYREYPS